MKEDRLDLLLHALFEERLEPAEAAELNQLLLADPAARDRYRQAAAVHAALVRKAAGPSYFDTPAPAVIDLPTRRPWLRAAAAVATLAAAGAAWSMRPHGPVAEVVETREAVWSAGSPAPTAGRLPVAVPLQLDRGVVHLRYPSGAKVTLAAPCRFRLDTKEALSVLHGRATVHTPEGAEGFRIDTPGGRFVDLGTEFGLAVGSDGTTPVILTEVFQGEVEVEATRTRLTHGESRALVREEGRPKLLASLDESPVMLVNFSTARPAPPPAQTNLALKKPVFSPGFCTRPHGSVFPPDNLTDGRLNDSGVPGDWSFWLAPDGEHGEFTVDLLEPQTIGRISLQNTGNRGNDDRGTAAFSAYGSLDNKRFFPLVEGELPRITAADRLDFPFHDFPFAATEARYVKVVVTRHYRSSKRPDDHPCQGGGLNEIRIFAP